MVNYDLEDDGEQSAFFKFLVVLIAIIAILVVVVLLLAGYGLIIWGIGNAIIWLFKLNATWTFLQSLVLALIIEGVILIFKWIF